MRQTESAYLPAARATRAEPSVRLAERAIPGTVRRLAQASQLLAWRPRWSVRSPDLPDRRRDGLSRLLTQLSAGGFLGIPDDALVAPSNVTLVPTGSSVNVAIIPADANRKAVVLKYTDSDVASAEITASSEIQRRLTVDPRLASWSKYLPDVLASGRIGTTTFAIEECLSLRDGRSVGPDSGDVEVLMAEALVVIDKFHRLTSSRKKIDGTMLAAIVDRPIAIVRANTSPGLWGSRHRALDRVSSWLRMSLAGLDLEVGWTHGDFHLGNILIGNPGKQVVGVIDWGRAEPDGLTVLDGFTLVVLESAKRDGKELGSYVLQLLREASLARGDRVHGDVLDELYRLLEGDNGSDLRGLLLLTWLTHVANNLKNEERAQSHALWSLRNVDLVLYGVAEILGS